MPCKTPSEKHPNLPPHSENGDSVALPLILGETRANLKLRARTGPTSRHSKASDGSMFRSVGLGAMFTRHAIFPTEGVGLRKCLARGHRSHNEPFEQSAVRKKRKT